MGGGSGGGGSSGKVDWPEYFKGVHGDWLSHGMNSEGGAMHQISLSMVQVMTAALEHSPFTGVDAYDPDEDINYYETAVQDFEGLVDALSATTDWTTYHTAARAAIDAYFMDDTDIAAKTAIVVANVDSYVDADETALENQQDTDIPAAITSFDTARGIDYLSATAALEAFTDAEIEAAEAAFNDQLDDEVETTALPRFKRGMQDVNAVVSSAFVVGQAWIESTATKKKAEFSAQLRLENYKHEVAFQSQLTLEDYNKKAAFDATVRAQGLQQRFDHMARQRLSGAAAKTAFDTQLRQQMYSKQYELYVQATAEMVKLGLQYVDFQRAVTAMIIEERRLKVVIKKEETDQNLRIDEMDGKWDLEVFQYGANLLAAGHGGTVGNSTQKATPTQSAVGGALSGAASGAMMGAQTGSPWGIGIGAVLGGVMGALG